MTDDVPRVSWWLEFTKNSKPKMPQWQSLPEPLPSQCHGISKSIKQVQQDQETVVRRRMRRKGPESPKDMKAERKIKAKERKAEEEALPKAGKRKKRSPVENQEKKEENDQELHLLQGLSPVL